MLPVMATTVAPLRAATREAMLLQRLAGIVDGDDDRRHCRHAGDRAPHLGRGRPSPLGHHSHGAAGQRFLGELAAIEILAPERDEQLAGQVVPGVGGDVSDRPQAVAGQEFARAGVADLFCR